MSSSGQNTLSQFFPNFNLACLNSNSPTTNQSMANRIKIKRCRQRVDAGEPRNSYQLNNDGLYSKMDTEQFCTDSTTIEKENDEEAQFSGENMVNNIVLTENSLQSTDGQSSQGSTTGGSSSRRKSFRPKRQKSVNSEDLEGCVTPNEEEEASNDNDDNEIKTESKTIVRENEWDEEEKCKNGMDLNTLNEEKQIPEEDNLEETMNEDLGEEEIKPDDLLENPMEHCQNFKQAVQALNSPPNNSSTPLPLANSAVSLPNFANSKFAEFLESHRRLYSTILEQQRKQLLTSQSIGPTSAASSNPINPLENWLISDKSRNTLLLLQQQNVQEVQKNFAKLEETLKNELMGSFTGKIDKVVAESFSNIVRIIEQMPLALRQQQIAELQLQHQQQQMQRVQTFLGNNNGNNVMASIATPTFGLPNNNLFPNGTAPNPLAAILAAAAAATNNNSQFNNGLGLNNRLIPPSTTSSGIFPSTQITPNFKGLSNSSLFPQPPQNNNVKTSTNEDGSPRKKRAKVTDTVRGPRSINKELQQNQSLPSSARSSPQLNFFAPTMVNNNFSIFGNSAASATATSGNHSRDGSPANNSDEFSDCGGPYEEGPFQKKYTLTHVHLRKAKLMFFYTRYPTSTILKTYFPDIHFNKNNTAQLVKWFSNFRYVCLYGIQFFREFFYMQMEKYAKQALAEGIRNRHEIVVTTESDIYKQLNQHYNRNNPPERLVFVIQETLKEFFVALQANKDAEPSWKKVIYKVIQQLDEQIPDYFKDPNFIETLEQS